MNSVLQCLVYCPVVHCTATASRLSGACLLLCADGRLTVVPQVANYLTSQHHSRACPIVGFCALCELEKLARKIFDTSMSAKRSSLQPLTMVLHVRGSTSPPDRARLFRLHSIFCASSYSIAC
jgi:hypothetical protein